MTRRTLIATAALLLLAGGGIGAYVLYTNVRGGDVRGSDTVEFAPTEVATLPEIASAPPAHTDVPPSTVAEATTPEPAFVWPAYGYNEQRLRSPPGISLRPPFRRIWTFRGRSLLEFPPAIGDGRLYLPTFDGRFYALDAATGKTLWRFESRRCAWSSPAIAAGLVYQTLIGDRGKCNDDTPGTAGELLAFDAATGEIRWRHRHGLDESSPVAANGLVYGGDWDGFVYALDAVTGQLRWRHRTDGAVKGSPAIDRGRLFIGSYDGHVYGLDAKTGAMLWKASGQDRIGSSGRFYSTPAAAYGRVYIGSTDGKVYSFGARTGELRWSHSTGGFVYSSPAVWQQLVLIGSYDGFFYALDAATGDERWRFEANGPISGSATVVDGIVYFSSLRERTYGLDAATGKQLWTWPDGKYSPVVADRERLYLIGEGRLYGMVERASSRP